MKKGKEIIYKNQRYGGADIVTPFSISSHIIHTVSIYTLLYYILIGCTIVIYDFVQN